MKMQIEIKRKSNNVRVGSRAWASKLPSDQWIWKTSRRGCEEDRIDIYNRDMLVASLNTDRSYDTSVGESVEFGGITIGNALMSDLNKWADELDLSVDDNGHLIVRGK